ncbi:dihydroorotate dehydrogenase [Trichonephila clavata]|uniref:Dihydroorotate dehydrogenase (quinone), mitochondrial n=1 Tax=Trichonephila clavata TaxID=2740835 RepID=A0A8X6HQS9_TRICU|nr:dihydroorotate dehydrogenase [Trichonephila clavata]
MSQRNLWKKLKSMTLLAAGDFSKSRNFCCKWALIPKCKTEDGSLLRTSLWGLEFSNPIGIAAGLDKNGEAYSGLFKSGIGFMEVGTVTPLSQSGNPKPRIFMLPEDEALINRCGFNSEGHNYVKRNLSVRNETGILGVNLGKNKESKSAEEDYVLGISEFAPMADYLTINVSSPNTPGLRSLQNRNELEHLLDKVLEARDNSDKKPPILLKIAPDLTHEEKKDIAHVVLRKGKKIDGLIVSNTTISRPDSLRGQHKNETGGLSGKP